MPDPTLRELATKAITDACPTEEQCHSAAALSTAGDCLAAHPIHVSGESNGAIFLVEGEPAALADVVLAAILPAYREQVLREVRDALRDHDRFAAWRSTLPVSGRPPYPSAEVMAHVADYVAAQVGQGMASDWIDRAAANQTAGDRPKETPDARQE